MAVPAGQFKQALAPVVIMYKPGTHTRQSARTFAPAAAANDPAAQPVHIVLFVLAAYLPAAQFEQPAAESPEMAL